MGLRDDERGQAIQVGAVLLFAILIVAFSTYQAAIIPADNRRVEFNHNQEVQDALADLRNAVLGTADSTRSQSVTIGLGTQYPSRTLGLNPPPASGSLRTVGTTDPLVNLTIENAVAADEETADLWDGTPRNYSTGAVRYAPAYHRYQEAPTTTYEHSVLYNRFSSSNELVLANQSMIDGDRISLVALNGSLDRASSRSTTVDVRPISSSTETILIDEQSASEPINLSFTSLRDADAWNRTFGNDTDVTVDQSPSPAGGDYHRIHVTLDGDGPYRLAMTKAAVGTGATAEDPAYLTHTTAENTSVQRGSSMQVTIAVRDQYNNPVAGVDVHGGVGGSDAGSLDGQITTDEDGRATFTYTTTESTEATTHQLNFTTNGSAALSARPFEHDRPLNASVNASVSAAGSAGDGGAYGVNWTAPNDEAANDDETFGSCTSEACTWDVGASGDEELVLNGTINPAFEGVDFEYAVSNSTVGTVSPAENATAANGAAKTTLTALENGTVDVLASGNDGSDTIEIDVQNVSDGGGAGPSRDRVMYVDGTGSAARDGDESRLDFDIEHTGGPSATITAVNIDSDAGNLASVYESNGGTGAGQHEVFIDSTDSGFYDDGDVDDEYTLGTTQSLTEAATLDDGETAQVTVLEFRNNGGQTASMADSEVTVELTFQDGSTRTYSFTPPGY